MRSSLIGLCSLILFSNCHIPMPTNTGRLPASEHAEFSNGTGSLTDFMNQRGFGSEPSIEVPQRGSLRDSQWDLDSRTLPKEETNSNASPANRPQSGFGE